MLKRELKALVESEIDNSYGADSGELSTEIGKGIDYYLGEPFGNEEEGRSQVISRDVMDVIEWIMPSIMRVFASNERAVIFDPVGPEDEKAAQQETDYVNHVFYKENDGFLILYTFFKDALLSKNGIVKVYWDPTKETEREEYERLTPEELNYIISDPYNEPIEHTENEDGTHDLVVLCTRKNGSAKVVNVPPEEFRLSKDANSLDISKARFSAHKTLKTRTELIEMGFSKSKVNSLPQYHGTDWYDSEIRIKRNNKDDDEISTDNRHKSTQLIEVHECYYRVDFDGDGIAELRQITIAGGEMLANEPVDRSPFVAITPIILTHKFHGLSIADITMDLQLIKSTIMRNILDNTYLANNGRTGAQDGMVDVDSLLTSRPGGVVLTTARPMDVLYPIPHNPLPPETFTVLEKMDQMRKERTGISQDAMGLEGNVLAHGRTGVISQSFDMARMRTELICRIFAEGVKVLMRELHAILQKHQDKQKVVKLRGDWVPVSPMEWKDRTNMTINVGLGSGNKDRQMANIAQVLQMQEKLNQYGIMTPQHVYNALEKFVEFAGLGEVSQYFPDPSKLPPKKDEPSAEENLAKAQTELSLAQAKAVLVQAETSRIEAQTNAQEAQYKHIEAIRKQDDDKLLKTYELELKYKYDVPGGLKNVG